MSSSAQTRVLTLTRILMQAGVVTEQQIESAIARQRETGQRSGELLVQMGSATEEDIGWALARQLNLTFIDPRPETLDHELIHSFPDEMLHRHVALPLVLEDNVLAIAVADPTDHEAIDELTLAAGRPLRLAVATASAIRRVLRDVNGHPRADRRAAELTSLVHASAQQHHAGALFLLERLHEARRAGAAEIHMIPHPDRLEVWHRVAGRLTATAAQARDTLSDVLGWIEAIGGPSLPSGQGHAWGRVACPAGPETIELSVSLLRQPSGICVTVEPLATEIEPSLERLGIDPVDVSRLREALSAPSGLGLIAGPPGSGGSTTLEAMAIELERDLRRCVRWDAIDIDDRGIGRPTAEGMSVALVHGADVIAIDDVSPDELPATLAPSGSGRWVLARVAATDTFALLEQLASTPLERAALAERLRFVVQQRRGWGWRDAESNATSHAAPRCSVFEVLVVDDGLREGLRAGDPGEVLRARAIAAGFVPLTRRLQVLVGAGIVSAAEAARLAA